MGKVKQDFSRTFKLDGEDVDIIIQWDVADDAEGYGVVIGEGDGDRTIAFGQGDLSRQLSGILFHSVVNELRQVEGDILPESCEFDGLETLYSWDEKQVLTNSDALDELGSIIEYIQKWYP